MSKVDEQKEVPEVTPKYAVTEFFERTTLHGVRYTVINGNKIRRVLWLLCVCIMTGCLLAVLANSVLRYFSYPTSTVITTKYEDEIAFPAVTICNVNQFRKSVLTQKYPLVNAALQNDSFPSFSGSSFNFSDSNNIDELNKIDLEEVSNDARHQLDAMIKLCMWGLEYIPCKDVFEPSVTTESMCYTFNSHHAIQKHGRRWNVTRSGQLGGLRLFINVEADEYTTAGSITLGTGVRAMVHEPDEFPDEAKSFSLPPGSSTSVALHKQKSLGLPPPYQPSWCENKEVPEILQYHTKYTFSACMEHCLRTRMVDKCGCRPLTSSGNDSVCPLGVYKLCGNEVIDKYFTEECIAKSCGCHQPCEVTIFQRSLSAINYPSKHMYSELEQFWPEIKPEEIRENTMEIVFYFEDFSWTEIKQHASYSLNDIAADFGGQMGLFLGASIITVLEFADFVCYLFSIICNKKRHQKTRTMDKTPDAKTNERTPSWLDNYSDTIFTKL